MPSQLEIAVIVSTYQRPAHLERSLLSLANQRGVDGNPSALRAADENRTLARRDRIEHAKEIAHLRVTLLRVERFTEAATVVRHGAEARLRAGQRGELLLPHAPIGYAGVQKHHDGSGACDLGRDLREAGRNDQGFIHAMHGVAPLSRGIEPPDCFGRNYRAADLVAGVTRQTALPNDVELLRRMRVFLCRYTGQDCTEAALCMPRQQYANRRTWRGRRKYGDTPRLTFTLPGISGGVGTDGAGPSGLPERF